MIPRPKLSKIEREVLSFAAKPGRKFGAFDIISELTKHQKPTRLKAIRRLMLLNLLRNVPGRRFAMISDEGQKWLLTMADEGS